MSVFDEIKAKVDIVDLVSETVQLQRAGRNFKAPCPFHTERTPSFIVTPERGTWHCFGACATGGDIFAFVQRRDGIDLPEAMRVLAERAGIPLKQQDPRRTERHERLYAANESAATYFHTQLLQADEAAEARAYLTKRGIDADTMRAFRLGYAPAAWDSLKTFLGTRGFAEDELIGAGLLVQGDRGGYDRFRGRLMFPIADERGRVIGFGARTLADETPKYLNTPQSDLFDKGGVLYALDRAKDSIRKEDTAVIVEGYMDVIAAHQHGFRNVVASMGTALTERQVNVLKRYSRNLTLALDADAAGSAATLRGLQVAVENTDRHVFAVPMWTGIVRLQEGLAADIRIVALPEGHDPDDVIRADPETWRRLVTEARPVLDHLMDVARERYELTQPRERSRAVDEILPVLAGIQDQVVLMDYLQRLATLARVELPVLSERLRAAQRKRAPRSQGEPAGQARAIPPKKGAREEFILALLHRHPSLRARGLDLSPAMFWDSEHRALFEAWRDERDPAADEHLRAPLERILQRELPPYDAQQADEALASAIRLLERERLLEAKNAAASALAEETRRIGEETLVDSAVRVLAGRGAAQDDDLAPAVAVAIADVDAGLRLHGLAARGTNEPDPGPHEKAVGSVGDECMEMTTE